jgi:hypothetical protein
MVYVPPLKKRRPWHDMPKLCAEQQSLSDQYGLRVASLERAVKNLPHASPAEIVRDAERGYAAMSGFLKGSRS